MHNSFSTLFKTSQLFRPIFTQNETTYSARCEHVRLNFKTVALCWDSIYLSWVVQIVVIEYGFNDHFTKLNGNTNRGEFYHDLSSNR